MQIPYLLLMACALPLIAKAEQKKSSNPTQSTVVTLEKAIFAAGCFWCVEAAFQDLKGVQAVTSGYTGGSLANPTYEQVTRENTGHREAVEVTYEPSQITYEELLEIFWKNTDPLDATGQFCDKGDSYRSGIYYADESQKILAEKSLNKISTMPVFANKKIQTSLDPKTKFWLAEDYHQDYYKKNPLRYKLYKYNCGRAKRLKELWN